MAAKTEAVAGKREGWPPQNVLSLGVQNTLMEWKSEPGEQLFIMLFKVGAKFKCHHSRRWSMS